jgi:hypothetical protein
MMYVRSLMTVLLVLILTGCFAKREIVPGTQAPGESAVSRNDAVAIMLPDDGTYGGTVYAGSGKVVATQIKQAVFGKVRTSEIIDATIEMTRKDVRTYCKDKGIRFLIQPSILHWEDRATNWSGMRDFIKIEILLVNPRDATTLNSVLYKASSSWWTFVNTPPEDMLDESFDQAVDRLISGR